MESDSKDLWKHAIYGAAGAYLMSMAGPLYRQLRDDNDDVDWPSDDPRFALHKARALENAAILTHEANRGYCEALGDMSQVGWFDAPEWQRQSALAGVGAIYQDPDTTPEQSHESWSEQKVADGWVYGEVKDADKKTHPCLVPYEKLPAVQRAKDVLFGGVCRAALKYYGLSVVRWRTPEDPEGEITVGSNVRAVGTSMRVATGPLSFNRAALLAMACDHALFDAWGLPVGEIDQYERSSALDHFQDTAAACIANGSAKLAYQSYGASRFPAIFPTWDETAKDNTRWLVMATWRVAFRVVNAVMDIDGVSLAAPGSPAAPPPCRAQPGATARVAGAPAHVKSRPKFKSQTWKRAWDKDKKPDDAPVAVAASEETIKEMPSSVDDKLEPGDGG